MNFLKGLYKTQLWWYAWTDLANQLIFFKFLKIIFSIIHVYLFCILFEIWLAEISTITTIRQHILGLLLFDQYVQPVFEQTEFAKMFIQFIFNLGIHLHE